LRPFYEVSPLQTLLDIGGTLPNYTEVEDKNLSVFYCRIFSALLQKFLLHIFTWTG
jgi:hypothetical protein